MNDGKIDYALKALEKAKSLNDDTADFHFIYGIVLTEKGRGELAYDSFKNALAKKPELEVTVKEIILAYPEVFKFLLNK